MSCECPEPLILLVEDSPVDYEITKRAFIKSGFKNELVRCEGGDEALDYLYRRGKYKDPKTSPAPHVVLLDLNMPGTDGRGVLKTIKDDPVLRRIPVIVLTTSDDQKDIEDCYALGANCYVQKPVNLVGFMDSIQQLNDFWFSAALLPKADA
ncbi:response regulator [Paremcibacter congregatus]|uniref:Two-component system response regulator n=1 Tax=Paremcibacter congregatus TaxID=2043170 RepID=A0A2G4YS87_9PROT|nr:response regulator [Paremcibacter congregatus]PHZ85199.1 two-component system response regulator [Paremcibacter congregatus]QDE27867.1 response regulator [Paremcibacter congregatus]